MPALTSTKAMLLAVALALVAGRLAGDSAAVAGVPLYGIFEFLGTLFVSVLKMLVVPLVGSALIVGIARSGVGGAGLRRIGLRTVSLYLLTTACAIVVGLVIVNMAQPGRVDGRPLGDRLAIDASSADLAEEMADKGLVDLLEVFRDILPTNVFSAAAGDDLLGVVFFAALFGYFMVRLDRDLAEPMLRFWSAVLQVMTHITRWVMHFAPLGVFGLVALAAARTDADMASPLLGFAVVVMAGLAAHVLLTLPLLMIAIGRMSPVALYRAVAPAVIVAFSSASSSAALPVTMDCLTRRAGVSNRVASVVLPLGAAVNMNGTALYECVAAVFLAQAYGLELDLATQFIVLAIAVATCVGLPGIPSASLVAVAVILSAIGLPTEAVGVLVAFDRLLEMARTAVNVLGDTACAAMVARLEGEPAAIEAAGKTRS